jgi:hypothetical protein
VRSARHSETLCDKLNIIKRGFKSAQCSLQWDAAWQAKACNSKRTMRTTVRRRCVVARPHTAAYTVETFQNLNFEVLEHPSYSPDTAPLDHHLFGPLKPAWRSRHSTKDQQPKETVHAWLIVSQPKTFVRRSSRK